MFRMVIGSGCGVWAFHCVGQLAFILTSSHIEFEAFISLKVGRRHIYTSKHIYAGCACGAMHLRLDGGARMPSCRSAVT
jgi:hypothetical protein